MLGRRGFAVESVVARTCREGGARVTTHMFVRDMDLWDFDRWGRLEVTLVKQVQCCEEVQGPNVSWVAKWQDDGLPKLASS